MASAELGRQDRSVVLPDRIETPRLALRPWSLGDVPDVLDFPDGYVHVWKGDAIIGQLEMRTKAEPHHHGYVNLFYLVDAQRGAGHGDALHEYALAFMRKHGVDSMQLSVSPTNVRALAYYRKHGWRDLGLRPGRDDVHLLERDVI